MTLNEPEQWPNWRVGRLMTFLAHRAEGCTMTEIAEKTPWSRSTVVRELNSPQAYYLGQQMSRQALALTSELLRRLLNRIRQFEDGEKMERRLALVELGRLVRAMLPRQVEQRVSGEIAQKVEVEIPDLGGLDEDAVAAIVENFMADEARRLRQEQPEALQSPEDRAE